MKHGIYLALFSISLLGCNQEQETYIVSIAEDYYQTYAERHDFEKFLSFYDSSIVLQDMISGDRIEGIETLEAFFDWSNPSFEQDDSVALVVTNQIIEKNAVVTSGYFTPFSWNGTGVEAMQFTSILSFNTEGKIIRHIDWINYPAYLLNYETRKNSNLWINSNE